MGVARRSHHQMSDISVCLSAYSSESPRSVAAFVLNSEPHNEARPSFRVCVGLTRIAILVKEKRNDESPTAVRSCFT
jgi:hypothetical protein